MSIVDTNLISNTKADQISNAGNKITDVGRTNESLTYATENPLAESEINTRYILIGVGAVVSLLLFILVVQSCRKANSTRRKSLKSRNRNKTDKESTDTQQHGKDRFCNKIALQKIPNQLFYHSDAKNHRMEEESTSLQVSSTPIYQQATHVFANNTLPLKSKYSHRPERPANHDFNVPTCDLYALPRPCTSEICLAANRRDPYIQPIFVCAFDRPNNTVKSHSYIDIIS